MSPVLLLADSSPTFTATVVISGISIVIGVLLLLIAVFYLFGFFVSKSQKLAENKKSNKSDLPPSVPAVVKAPAPAVNVQTDIGPELVAVITAAIAASEGKSVTIRSIKRKDAASRNPWAQAAIADNTQPF